MKTSPDSQLGTFKVSKGEKRGTLNVECPRRECRGRFIVSRRWLEGHEGYDTASCPYCFKTSRRT